jgi:hypothetical protein
LDAPEDDRNAAWIQEASCAERVVVLKIRVVGPEVRRAEGGHRTAYVVLGHGQAGLVTSEARRAAWGGKLPPGAVRQRAREDALAGSELLALGEAEAFVDQRGMARVVRATPGGRVVVTDERPPSSGPASAPFALLDADARRQLEEHGAGLVAAIALDALELRRGEVARILDRAAARIERRREAVRGDLGKIAQADSIAGQAQWLVAAAAKAPRGATSLVVTDWSTGEARPLEVPLDPSKSAKDQIAAMFKRAKRLRLGARIAEERLAQAETQLLAVEIAKEDAARAASLPALEDVVRDAKKAAPRDVSLPGLGPSLGAGKGAKAGAPRRSAYRTFVAGSGRRILVGKGAADNDELTLHVARPHDTWLHAKDRTGAHVIVPLDKGRTCPGEDLVDAAHLAAHFSDAREEAVVDVQYTDRRHLRKPKGSPPGFVIVDREKVLVLRVEPARVRGLLEREEV